METETKIKNLLINANTFIIDENFEKAIEFYNEIIKLKVDCYEAWWGLYICNDTFDKYYGYEDKFGNKDVYTKANIMAETIRKYANRAIEYAPSEIVEKYRNELKEKLEFIEDVKNGKYDKKSLFKVIIDKIVAIIQKKD